MRAGVSTGFSGDAHLSVFCSSLMPMSYAVQVQETHAECSHRVRLPFHFAQVHVRSQWQLAHVLGAVEVCFPGLP